MTDDSLICKRCVLNSTDPALHLDSDGICNLCREYERVDEAVRREFTAQSLEKQLNRIKREGKGKDYDAIVGLSGGVDSTYSLYLATKVYGLRVLALHVDAGWNAEIAVANIHAAVKACGVDLHTEVIDWNAIRELQRVFFKASVVNCDIPQDHVFKAMQYKTARNLGIKNFISGRNYNTDAMMPADWVWPNHDGHHIKSLHRKFSNKKLKNYPTFEILYGNIFTRYFYGFKDLRILEYVNYRRDFAKRIIADELGWRDYGGKHHESIFTEFYQTYYLPEKFGIDKRRAHLSGEINNGELTRAEALQRLESPPISDERRQELVPYVLKKLSFTDEEWSNIMAESPIPHDFYPNHEYRLRLLKRVVRIFRSRAASK